MLVSYKWLQEHFEKPLPKPEELQTLLTFHAFEIEGGETKNNDTVFDIDVLPNRSSDCLAHYGVAKEIGTLTGLRAKLPEFLTNPPEESKKTRLSVKRQESTLCSKYLGRMVRDVTVKKSPEWLQSRLNAIEQKSINTIVDATNYVMFELGGPLHAFDADKLDGEICIRMAKAGEAIITLDGAEISLDPNTLIIADEKAPIAIAGIKGGKKASVDENTKNIVLESANFDPVSIRKTSSRLKIRTESSKRFENEVPSSVTDNAIVALSSLIAEIASHEKTVFEPIVDESEPKRRKTKILLSEQSINRILGSNITPQEMQSLFRRLYISFETIDIRERIVSLASEVEGVLYRYGFYPKSLTPEAFDSASLTHYIFSECGVKFPKKIIDQFVFTHEISSKDLCAGDLIFSNAGEEEGAYESIEWFPKTKVSGGVDHCGIYLGNGNILHTSREIGKVVVEPLEKSRQFKNIVGRRRFFEEDAPRWLVTPPDTRPDLVYPEDIAEEIGRVYGYKNIEPVPIEQEDFTPIIKKKTYSMALIRRELRLLGFFEVITHIFDESGEQKVSNPPAENRSFLRSTLVNNLERVLIENAPYAPFLGQEVIKIFEIGKVFRRHKEETVLTIAILDTITKKEKRVSQTFLEFREHFREKYGITFSDEPNKGILELPLEALIKDFPNPADYGQLFREQYEVSYKPLSTYPFLLRDIAVFVPETLHSDDILRVLNEEAKELLVKSFLFDVFEKKLENGEKQTSYAYHLVFQSKNKTLSDDEVGQIMSKAEKRLSRLGFLVR